MIIVPPDTPGNGVAEFVAPMLPRIGYAVDVGANNGICLSNTKQFEDKGWTVLCVEPNPQLTEEGKRNRKLWVQCACGPEDKAEVEFVSVGVYPWAAGSGLRTATGDLAENDMPKQTYTVPQRTLNRLLTEAKFPRLDYLTVDVEWHDLEVIQGIDLMVWKPVVVVAESIDMPRTEALVRHLDNQGYTLINRIEFDNVFLRRP